MKKNFYIILICILTSVFSKAQTTWEKLFSNTSTDVFRCVIESPAGGYAIAGYTADSTVSDTDAYVVRINTIGDTLWTYRQNIGLSKKDLFYKIINTSDGGFAMCGYTNSITGLSDDVLITKINSSGQFMWTKTWGGSGKDRAQDIIQLADNSYAIVGYTTSPPAQYYDAFLYRINSVGDSLLLKRYGSAAYDDANAIRALANGGFILGGQSSNGANGFDQYLIRTNDSGDTLWTRKFGTTGTDNIESIALGNNGFYLTGGTNGAGVGGDDGYLVKTDTSGNVLFAKTFGGSAPDDFHRVELTSDGGLILSGTTSSTGPLNPNMWLLRTNAAGDSLWSKAFGGNNHDHGYSAQETSDGGFIIAGHSGSFGFNGEEAYVVKTDMNGNVINHLTYIVPFALTSPTTTTCGGPGIQIKILIRNFGDDSVPNVPAQVVISGGLSQTINGTYNGTFHAQDADTLIFSTPINTTGGGTYTFTITTLNANDVIPARNSLVVTITLDGNTGAPVIPDVPRCGPGNVTLNATTTGNVYWFTSPSGGSPVASGLSYTTPSLTINTVYYAQTGLNCPSARTAVTAQINQIPAAPITSNSFTCGPGTVTLTASSTDPINWYDSGSILVGSGTSFTTPIISANTTYFAQADNGNCQSSLSSANADFHIAPNVSVGPDTSIEIGMNYTMTASPSFIDYLWTNTQTTQQIFVTQPSNYCVNVTDGNGCTATDCANVTFYVGTNDLNKNNLFVVYPNPAIDKLSFVLNQSSDNTLINLIDLSGKSIITKTIKNNSPGYFGSLSLSGISQGIYFIKIIQDEKSFTEKIIIQ